MNPSLEDSAPDSGDENHNASPDQEEHISYRKNSISQSKRQKKLIEPEPLPFSLPARQVTSLYAQCAAPAFPAPEMRPQWSRRNSSISYPDGRYVSKRERTSAAAAVVDASPWKSAAPLLPSPGMKDILNAAIPNHIRTRLQNLVPEADNYNRLPRRQSSQLKGHTMGVNTLRWSPTHVSLLASAGMDKVAIIWNVWNGSDQQMVRRLNSQTAPMKDIQWSVDGTSVVSCGFDNQCRLIDVEIGSYIKIFLDDQVVSVVKFHPMDHDLFLSGGSKGTLKLWDVRTGNSVREYSKGLGQIMDVDFSFDGKQFVSTSDMARRHASDKSIVVWDYNSQVVLSNQVYVEAYTCPCVRYHPFQQTFIAQSNANYIAIFSARPPFRMDKYKRFEGHQVSAYHVRCNFSPCGGFVVTGSADGCVYIYNFRTSNILRKLEAHHSVCTDVSYHPVLPSVMASCSLDGLINIYE